MAGLTDETPRTDLAFDAIRAVNAVSLKCWKNGEQDMARRCFTITDDLARWGRDDE